MTPAASPYCGMLHAQKDLVDYSQILKLFVPMVFIAIIVYTVIGYQIANILFK